MRNKFNDVLDTRDAGQEEYAHNTQNVFANFERIGNNLKTDRKKVLMTYLLKHIDGIIAHINGHQSQREDVSGRILDAIVYLFLLWGMEEEKNTINTDLEELLDDSGFSSTTNNWYQKIGDRPSER